MAMHTTNIGCRSSVFLGGLVPAEHGVKATVGYAMSRARDIQPTD